MTSVFSPLNLLYPMYCLLCGELLEKRKKYPLCRGCSESLPRIEGERCVKCGRALISEHGICMDCRERRYLFDRHLSVFEYRDGIRRLIKRYKFHEERRLAAFFAEQLGYFIREHFPSSTIIPVPCSMQSKRKRGWDQIETVAGILEKTYHLEVLRMLRRKKSKQQKVLDFEGRTKNIENMIVLKRNDPTTRGKNILLLDDVFTTGATVNECSKVLLEAGFRKVAVVTIAID